MEKAAARQMSPLALAFLGDAVFGLYVREKLLLQGNAPAQQLHRKAVGYVCARAQSKAVEEIAGLLSPDEESVYRRGRNAHSRPPKNTDVADYRRATGLEALFGYLHLCGETDRARDLFQVIWGDPPKE